MEEPWYSSKLCSSPSFDEHKTARIGCIVNTVLGAGADVYAKDTHNSTPLDLAIAFNCAEMMQLLKFSAKSIQKGWGLDESDVRLQTVMAMKPEKSLSNLDLPEPVSKEILRKPMSYMSYLSPKDIEWIAHNGGDLTGSEKSIPDRYGDSSESVLQEAAERGLIEVMTYLGDLAKVNDDPQVVLLLLIKNSDNEKIKFSMNYAAATLHFACKGNFATLRCWSFS
jgi:ankyrin repeat protein